MYLNKLRLITAALASTAAVTFAQDAANPAEPAKAAEPAKIAEALPEPPKPKFDPKEYLAMIPDTLAEYTVDGKVVKVSSEQVKAMLENQLGMMAAQGMDAPPKEQFKKYLPNMAEEAALQAIIPLEAAKNGFGATPEKIDAELEKIKAQLAMLKKQQFKDDDKLYQNFLKQQGAASEEEFLSKLKNSIAKEMPMRDYSMSIEQSVTVSEEEIKAFFDSKPEEKKYYVCSHILAAAGNPQAGKPATPEEDAAALKKITEIQAKLKAGEKFEDLARQYSDCPSKEEGGKLGEYNPEAKMPQGQMVQEFTDGFNALKPGEISDKPVKTMFGYHLIKASEVKERKFEDVKAQIGEILKRQKLQKKIPEIIEQLKKDYKLNNLMK